MHKANAFCFFVLLSMFEYLKALDRALFAQINDFHTPLMDELMWHLSDSWHTILVVCVVAYAFYKKYSLKKAAEIILGCAIVFACTDLTSNVIKHQVKRYRPTHNLEIKESVKVVNNYYGGKYGFFSAHASNSFGVITFLILAINWIQLKYKLLLYIYPFFIIYSRVYLGVHYPSDVIAGSIYGVIFGLLIYKLIERYFLKLHDKNLTPSV